MKTLKSSHQPEDDNKQAQLQRLLRENAELLRENAILKEQQHEIFLYIRKKVDQLLQVIGTVPLKPEELDNDTLLELDPIGIVSDSFSQVIEHLKETNEDLKVIHDELQAIFDSAPISIVVLDRNRRIINCNNYVRNNLLKNVPVIMGQPCYHAICSRDAPLDECLMQRVLEEGTSCQQLDWQIEDLFYDVIATPIRNEDNNISAVVLVFVDVTTQKRLDEEMARSLKLESLGLLAGGLAHDFNNFLASILNNVTLARLHCDAGDKVCDWLYKTEKAASQAQHLTQQLLTFAKGGLPVVQEVAVDDLVRDSVSFALSGSNVQCSYNIAHNLWDVKVDPGQIDQVVRNLIINALQAMPQGGKIEISCQNRTVSEGVIANLKPGNYVAIKISDNGVGIESEKLAKIFDPYFTTKESGSGLGLAISHAIINKHMGHISVVSELGAGTSFELLLPAIESRQKPIFKVESQTEAGCGRILVMDDDEVVCETTSELLTFIGYTVVTAADGREAVRLFQEAREQGEPIDLVILDLTVPGGMGGEETIRQLCQIDPQVIGIATSGYCNNAVMANYLDYGFKGVLPKPCKLETMQQVITELLQSCS